jgi:hypothetical protein
LPKFAAGGGCMGGREIGPGGRENAVCFDLYRALFGMQSLHSTVQPARGVDTETVEATGQCRAHHTEQCRCGSKLVLCSLDGLILNFDLLFRSPNNEWAIHVLLSLSGAAVQLPLAT